MTHAELTHGYELREGMAPSDCPEELSIDHRLPEPYVDDDGNPVTPTGQVTITQYRCRRCGFVVKANDTLGVVIRWWHSTAEPPSQPGPMENTPNAPPESLTKQAHSL